MYVHIIFFARVFDTIFDPYTFFFSLLCYWWYSWRKNARKERV